MFKFLSVLSSLKAEFIAALSLALFSVHSFAADAPDYTAITSAVDMGAVITAIMAIAAILAGLYVVIMGVKKLILFLRTN
ncbi:hypothetical protein [Citrobacter meridianamericanus]|uniref:hypothetical protein n=1 Tax=Citrobacter meridianamericanus TaxID=2894201 RepID=UPI00351D687A